MTEIQKQEINAPANGVAGVEVTDTDDETEFMASEIKCGWSENNDNEHVFLQAKL